MQQPAPTWWFYSSSTFLSSKLTLIMQGGINKVVEVSEIELYGKGICTALLMIR